MSFPQARPLGGEHRLAYEPPTLGELLRVRGNFCNLRESGPHFDAETGRLIPGKGLVYDPALPAVWAHDYPRFQRWIELHRQADTTHLVIGPFHGGNIYPGVGVENPDFLNDPLALLAFVETLTETPAADGKGFRLIVQLDGGNPNPRPRIAREWPVILTALSGIDASCIVSPGWELIKASDWTSADFAYALQWLAEYRKAHGSRWLIGAHMSPGRSAFSSNPVEPDDPWRGAEAECWTSHGGERIDVCLFQAIPPRVGDNPEQCVLSFTDGGVQLVCAQHGRDCWLDRTWDSLLRLGAGRRGWRQVPWVLFEHAAYPSWHEGARPEWARQTASQVQALAQSLGIEVGFCNGLPLEAR